MDLIFIQQKKIFDAMESYPFSINIDECTSNNHQKVFCYFDEKLGLSVVHYKSVSTVEVNTLNLFKKICEQLPTEQIPFENLVSDLSDEKMRCKLYMW